MKKRYLFSLRMIVQTIFAIIVGLFVFSPYLFEQSSKAESLSPMAWSGILALVPHGHTIVKPHQDFKLGYGPLKKKQREVSQNA